MGFNIYIIDKEFCIEKLIDNKSNEYLFSYFNSMKAFLKDFNTKQVDLVLLNLIVNDCDYDFFVREVHKFNSIPIILLATKEQKELAKELISLGCSEAIIIDEPNLNKNINKIVANYTKKSILNWNNNNDDDLEKLPEVLFADKKTKETFKIITKIAKTDISVLIQGENGVGKEIYARRIHQQSNRRNGPFVVVNSAILAGENIDNILFGYYNKEKRERIAGKFETANGGTIYFDEIGDLKPDIQAKILRILQEKELEIYETNEIINLDFRIISSTNKDLFEEIEKGNFKENLLYRINAFSLKIEPLRERKADIPVLTKSFMHLFNEENGTNINEITQKAMTLLTNYNWPGNVRELKNVIYRAMSLTNKDVLEVYDFNFLRNAVQNELDSNMSVNILTESGEIKTINQLELEIIQKVMGFTKGNISAAAKMLNLGRATFYRKLKELNYEE